MTRPKLPRDWLLGLLLMGAGALLVVYYLTSLRATPPSDPVLEPAVPLTATPDALTATLSPRPTITPEPLLPTPAPAAVASPTPRPSRTPLPAAIAGQIDPAAYTNPPLAHRFGVSGGAGDVARAREVGLPITTFFNWRFAIEPPPLEGVIFWQTVRMFEGQWRWEWADIEAAVLANPGSVWIIGNEPDVRWQDNTAPQRYAEMYHEAYHFIKERDPTAQVAIAGVAQATPLRLAYLDLVLATYQEKYGRPMPVDIWTIHNFILHEERDSWGVDIPPGMDDDLARAYAIEDHDDMEIFARHLFDFREWMAARGYQDRPLALTEFGILMPVEYGFPQESNAEFMRQTFDFLLTAAGEHGYPQDDNRLVQWWFWYSLRDSPDYYPTGNLYDRENHRLTLLGETFAGYLEQLLADE